MLAFRDVLAHAEAQENSGKKAGEEIWTLVKGKTTVTRYRLSYLIVASVYGLY